MNNQTFEKEKATFFFKKKTSFCALPKTFKCIRKKEKKKQARASCCIDLSLGLRVLQPRECCVMFF